MLPRYSVKKPFTTLVAAIIVILLGIVCITRMKTDLLPEINIPYIAVVTVEVGASPEQVEADVTEPLESSLGTVNGVENVYSTSSENYSLVFLEFADDTNMDSAMVKVSEAVNEASAAFPDGIDTPTLMQISMDMVATMYVGVNYDGKDIFEISDFVDKTVQPALERIDGVASVSSTGLVNKEVSISVSESKIEDVNNRILGVIDDSLYEAKRALENGQSQINSTSAQLDALQAQLDEGQAQVDEGWAQLDAAIAAQSGGAYGNWTTLKAAYDADPSDPMLQALVSAFQASADQLNSSQAQMDSSRSQLASTRAQLGEGQSGIDSGWSSYYSAREQAVASADVGALLDKDTIAALIYAQDFEMPAGYIDDATGTKWLLQIGDSYKSVADIENMVLFKIDGIGDIKIKDIADIAVQEAGTPTFAKINGQDAVLMAVSKSSTAATSDVSNAVIDELAELEADHSGLTLTNLIDQGAYIRLFIKTILQSLILGALLAIVVLALFLRDVKPTIVIAFSIPFSVLFALVIMYFAGISINAMTLGALSLAIGMLVDNSVVVMENIYRLRARGLSAARASVQGAKQVAGAIISSTLTTIAVFLPGIFTTGTVRQLMMPFALTIAFALIASLVVALTVIPTLGSYLFKRTEVKQHRWFLRLQDSYSRLLERCLRHKGPVLLIAGGLLVASVALCLASGIRMLPEITSTETNIVIDMPDGVKQEAGDAVADEAMARIAEVEGVAVVGGIDSGATTTVMASSLTSAGYTGQYQFYVSFDDTVKTERAVKRIVNEIEETTADLPCDITISNDVDMSQALGSSGLTIKIAGSDIDTLLSLSSDVMDCVGQIEGYENITDGNEEGDTTLRLNIDKDAAARAGLTVAQIYKAIADQLTTSKSAITMMAEGSSVDVTVVDETKPLTVENLLALNVQDNAGNNHAISEFATLEHTTSAVSIGRENQVRTITVTADAVKGFNATTLANELEPLIAEMDVPAGYTVTIGGESEQVYDMLKQMLLLIALGFILIYLVMVAQFQSLLSPFIIIFTVPLAFTGGMLALFCSGQQLDIMSLLGFVVLMGTVVNNGIVLVDYVNQLRLGGLSKHDALVAGGRTRMRPILITALTTILAMCALIFTPAIGSSLQRGMATVVAGGLLYATFMTLFVLPVLYDIFNRKQPHVVDLGPDNIDDAPDDATELLAQLMQQRALDAADKDKPDVGDEADAVESMDALGEASAAEEASAVEEASAAEEITTTEEASAAEEVFVVEEAPAHGEPSATEETPTAGKSPAPKGTDLP